VQVEQSLALPATSAKSNVQTVDDVAVWMNQIIASKGCGAVKPEVTDKILSSIRENEIDRWVLSTLTEDDIRDTLGVFVPGQRLISPEPENHAFKPRHGTCMPECFGKL